MIASGREPLEACRSAAQSAPCPNHPRAPSLPSWGSSPGHGPAALLPSGKAGFPARPASPASQGVGGENEAEPARHRERARGKLFLLLPAGLRLSHRRCRTPGKGGAASCRRLLTNASPHPPPPLQGIPTPRPGPTCPSPTLGRRRGRRSREPGQQGGPAEAARSQRPLRRGGRKPRCPVRHADLARLPAASPSCSLLKRTAARPVWPGGEAPARRPNRRKASKPRAPLPRLSQGALCLTLAIGTSLALSGMSKRQRAGRREACPACWGSQFHMALASQGWCGEQIV